MSWKTVRLSEVIKQRKAFITISDSEEYKRCRVQVNRKGVVLRDVVKGSAINTKKQQVCKEGDFLVAEIDAKVGGYGFVGPELEGAIVSSHYFLFEVNEELMLKEYLNWLIKTDIIQDQISSKGSTNYAAIRPAHVLAFEIPLPDDIDDQKAIVDRLNTIYAEHKALNTELTKQQTYLHLLRQTILQEAVQGKLTHREPTDEPASILLARIKAEKAQLVKVGKLKKEKELPPITDAEVPFALPEGWVWCRFDDIAIIRSNLVDPTLYPNAIQIAPDVIEKGTGKLLCKRTVKQAEVKSWNHYFFPNQIIYSKIRPKLSKSIIVNFEGLCSADMYPIESLIDINYLQLFILSEVFLNQVTKNDNRVKMPKINQEELGQVLVPLPPIQVQRRISIKTRALEQYFVTLEIQMKQNHSQAAHLLQAVLKGAFTQNEYFKQEVFHNAEFSY